MIHAVSTAPSRSDAKKPECADMQHATFVIGSYVVTFVGIGAYVVHFLRTGRRLSSQVPDEEKPWI